MGCFENGKRHGRGLFYGNDFTWYHGNWENDKRNGFGRIFWSLTNRLKVDERDLCQYEGDFKDDKKHGMGKRNYFAYFRDEINKKNSVKLTGRF